MVWHWSPLISPAAVTLVVKSCQSFDFIKFMLEHVVLAWDLKLLCVNSVNWISHLPEVHCNRKRCRFLHDASVCK